MSERVSERTRGERTAALAVVIIVAEADVVVVVRRRKAAHQHQSSSNRRTQEHQSSLSPSRTVERSRAYLAPRLASQTRERESERVRCVPGCMCGSEIWSSIRSPSANFLSHSRSRIRARDSPALHATLRHAIRTPALSLSSSSFTACLERHSLERENHALRQRDNKAAANARSRERKHRRRRLLLQQRR